MTDHTVNVIGFFNQQCPSTEMYGSDRVVQCMEVILSKFPICRLELHKGVSRRKIVSMYHDMIISRNPGTKAAFDEFVAGGASGNTVAMARPAPQTQHETKHRRHTLHGFTISRSAPKRPATSRFASMSESPRVSKPPVSEPEEVGVDEEYDIVERDVEKARGISAFLTRQWGDF